MFDTKVEPQDGFVEVKAACDWEVDYLTGSAFSVTVADTAGDVSVYGMEDGTVCANPTLIADCTRAGGEGVVEAEVAWRGQRLPGRVRRDGRPGLYRVSFKPKGPGVYKVWIYYNGKPVKGSPFLQEIEELAKPEASGPGLYKGVLGQETSFTVDPKNFPGEINITMDGPSQPLNCRPGAPGEGGVVDVHYTPTERGPHTVNIVLDGDHIKGSPFTPLVVDPASVRPLAAAGGVIPCRVHRECSLPFDVTDAGPGELTARVEGPLGVVPAAVDAGPSQHTIAFTPREEGKHLVHVLWGGVPLVNSPYTALATREPNMLPGHVTDASLLVDPRPPPAPMVHVIDRPTTPQPPRGPVVNVINRGPAQPTPPPPAQAVVTSQNKAVVEESMASRHAVVAESMQSSRAVVAESMQSSHAVVEESMQSSHSAVAESAVRASHGSHVQSSSSSSHVVKKNKVVKEEKQLNLIDPALLAAELEMMTDLPDNRQAVEEDFAASSAAVAHAALPGRSGLYEVNHAETNVAEHNEKISNVAITNTEITNQQVSNTQVSNTQIENVQIANSVVNNTEVSNTQMINTQVNNNAVSNTQVSNTEISNTQVNNVNVNNAAVTNTIVNNHVINNEEVKNEVVNQSRVNNVEVTNTVVNNKQINGVQVLPTQPPPPALTNGHVVEPAPQRVVLSGRGLREAVVGHEASFIVDGSQAEDGVATASLAEMSDLRLPVTAVHQGGMRYRCTYTAERPGAHLLYVDWNRKPLRGSPFKVNVRAAAVAVAAASSASAATATNTATATKTASKVVSSGFTSTATAGADWSMRVDARQAGDGHLRVVVTDPRGALVPCRMDDNGDGTKALRVTPRMVGRHVVDIRYDGHHIMGSPYAIDIVERQLSGQARAWGPGTESGTLDTFQGTFWVDISQAGGGDLKIRVMGPKGAFHVHMEKAPDSDKVFMCSYDPREPGVYHVDIQWSGLHVAGSPFVVLLAHTQQQLQHMARDYKAGTLDVSGSWRGRPAGSVMSAATKTPQSRFNSKYGPHRAALPEGQGHVHQGQGHSIYEPVNYDHYLEHRQRQADEMMF